MPNPDYSSVAAKLPVGRIVLVAFVVLSGAAAGAAIGFRDAAPTDRHIRIAAYQYAYEPERIEVNTGDVIHLQLWSRDVIHGFFLEGHDINAEIYPHKKAFEVEHPESGRPTELVEEITFTVGAPGKYRYRCSHTCGTLHPFMNGEMVVAPNTPMHAGVGGTAGLFFGLVMAFWPRRSRESRAGGNVAEAGDE